jgi:hypothetical protein
MARLATRDVLSGLRLQPTTALLCHSFIRSGSAPPVGNSG